MCTGFFASSSFHTEKLVSETGISVLNTAVTAASAVRQSSKFDPWGAIGVEAGLYICMGFSHRIFLIV